MINNLILRQEIRIMLSLNVSKPKEAKCSSNNLKVVIKKHLLEGEQKEDRS